MHRHLLTTAAFIALSGTQAAMAACVPQREAASLQLADFRSPTEIVKPPAGKATRGVVILFAGSDIADMDGAVVGTGDLIVSRPLRQAADRLACEGFASLRYNKRYVTGATTADRDKFATLTGADLAADGATAIAFVKSRPEFAAAALTLFGWSEGSTVAMAVAAAEPDVKAIVLMAPVIGSSAATVQAHYARIGKPYLARYATNDALDAAAVARADAGPGGVLAKIFVRMFRGFVPGQTINPLLDANKDNRISFSEADPVIASWYADTPDGGLGMSATGRALKGVADAYSGATPPLLILQGANDAMVDPAQAQAFARRPEAKGRVTLLQFAGLGHSLGRARSALEDGLLAVEQKPLDAMSGWLSRTLKNGR